MKIRTVAAIIAWIVVALLLLNRLLLSEWVLPIAIILTIIAILVYFSPRLINRNKLPKKQLQPGMKDQNL